MSQLLSILETVEIPQQIKPGLMMKHKLGLMTEMQQPEDIIVTAII